MNPHGSDANEQPTLLHNHARYDVRGRNLSVTYPYGPNSSNTPSKYFVYDSATVNSVAMANAAGRMAEAYTCVLPCSSKVTDEGFSYTVLGQVSDFYESTSHSNGYYYSAATYWANGVVDSLTTSSGYATNYNLDSVGRVYSAGPGGNQLASTVYNAANQAAIVTFASLDSDSFTYDPATDRMTQYQFNVNGQSVTGALTWNANGTLQKLNITDPFNSANTQTCKYGDPTASPPVPGYDDLGRLASANCGSIWSQTFSYDAFGNITKSGTSQFQPTYSYATNQMSSIGSFTPTYDSNGGVLSDGLHSYAWDSDTRPITIDTVAVTYDALDRMVEQNKGGVYTQILYSPTGFQMELMNGQSFVKAFVPMPGGTEEVWQASGASPYYRHSDWLGSSRFASTSTRAMYNDLAYAPFGEQYAQAGSTGVTDTSFAGNDEDTVTNLYDAQFREYGIQGRWPSPDPAGVAAIDPSNPQSWNRYAYVMNNPLATIDPQGTDPCTATSPTVDCPNGGGGIASGCIGADVGSSTFQQCGGYAGYAGGGAWFRFGLDPFDLMQLTELDLTGGIPVPASAYNPKDPSNPSLRFDNGSIYLDDDQFVGTYSTFSQAFPNYSPQDVPNYPLLGAGFFDSPAARAARAAVEKGTKKITNPDLYEVLSNEDPTQVILRKMYNGPVAKAFRLLGSTLGGFINGVGDFIISVSPCATPQLRANFPGLCGGEQMD